MNCAILLSGGTGTRMGQDIPKQYLTLHGRPVVTYSLGTLGAQPEVDGIVVVAHEDWRERILEWMSEGSGIEGAREKFLAFADPGETRQLSIWNALVKVRECDANAKANSTAVAKAKANANAIAKANANANMNANTDANVDAVIIHDAARPFVSRKLLSRCIGALSGHDGVMPVLHAKDTYYLLENGRVAKLLDRDALVAGQAPEVFDYGKYYAAHEALSREELLRVNGSTEVAVLAGMDVVTVEGDERNIKITTPNDLRLAERYLEEEA